MAYVKSAPSSHPEAAAVEAAGLRWLAEPQHEGGVAIVQVHDVTHGHLELEEIAPVSADRAAAERFGAALARMHRSLPEGVRFGELPPQHPEGASALFGPADQPLVLGSGASESWGLFQARERLDPVLEQLWPRLSADQQQLLGSARDRIGEGDFDGAESPSRLHGDLWAGNVMWRRGGGGVEAVLIDPAAHAGHRESDVAMLDLFGLPHLDVVLQAYDHTAPLAPGWQDRVPVHQLFPLTVHWLLFGHGYQRATLAAAEHTCTLRV